jgi:hypothetical protein
MTRSPTFSPAAETKTPPQTSGPAAPRPSPPGPMSPASPWLHNHAHRRTSLSPSRFPSICRCQVDGASRTLRPMPRTMTASRSSSPQRRKPRSRRIVTPSRSPAYSRRTFNRLSLPPRNRTSRFGNAAGRYKLPDRRPAPLSRREASPYPLKQEIPRIPHDFGR